MNQKKIYVIDLDETLCHIEALPNENNRWDYQNAKPIVNRIEIVNNLYDDGHEIIIDTARGSVSGKDWYEETKKQIYTWGLKFHTLRTGVKFAADYYIDDKAIKDSDFFK